MSSTRIPNNPFEPPLEVTSKSAGAGFFSWKRAGFWLGAILIILTVLVLLLPATRNARPAVRRAQCQNQLKQIGLALHNYADTHGQLPPLFTVDEVGRPLHSWRTLILPFLDRQDLYRQIDLSKPWDDPIHDTVRKSLVSVYVCPATDIAQGQTTYLANPAAWDFANGQELGTPEDHDRLDDFDSTMVLVFEVDAKQAVEWMSPQDGDYLRFVTEPIPGIVPHVNLTHILRADGSVETAGRSHSEEQWPQP